MYLSSKITTTVGVHFTSLMHDTVYRTDEYVFILVQLGAIRAEENEESVILSENDIFLCRPEQEYRLSSISQNRIVRIELGRDFLDSRLEPNTVPLINTVSRAQASDQELHQILTGIMLYYEDPRHESLLAAHIWQLLDLVLNHYLAEKAPDPAGKEYVERRIRGIKNLIEQNYYQHITLPELAEQLFLTPQYLSKFMRVQMGTTFNHYLNDVRITHAFEALEQTNATITQIALDNGFPSSAAFSSQFARRYGVTPSVWRKENHSEVPAKHPLQPAASQNSFPEEAGASDIITIRADRGTPFYPAWKDTINIGQLSNALSTSFEESFTRAQKQVGFRYVRFYNLFDDNLILPASEPPGTYNFYHLDTIFDFFRKIHILPFIDISYKPPKTGNREDILYDDVSLFRKKKPLEEELLILDSLLRHFINRYGRPEVSRWRFEIWAEHINLLEYRETPAEYWTRFGRMRDVIKNLLPEAAVGGPGYNVAAGSGNFEDLMMELKDLPYRPDFLSIYLYCYEATVIDDPNAGSRSGQFRLLTMDPDYPIRTLREYTRLSSRALEETLPVYITEFNSGLLAQSYVTASAFQAAFLMRNFIALSADTSCIGYWHFSDMTDEAVTLDQGFPQGVGLINYAGIPNPSWFVYEMMSRLDALRLLSADGLLVCGNNHRKLSLVACNYAHFTRNYCFTYMEKKPFTETYQAIEAGKQETRTYRFDNLDNGIYQCTSYRVGRAGGCLLDEIIRLVSDAQEQGLQTDELLAISQMYDLTDYREAIHPQQEIELLKCSDHSLTIQTVLEPLDIICITLERLT